MIARASLALASVSVALLGCARSAEPPRAAAVVAAPAPPAPAWPEAAPVPSAPVPDAAGPTSPTVPATEFAAREELEDVHFAPGQVPPLRADRKIVDASAAWLTANPSQLVIIEGHTDMVGPRAANQALAQRRARWVMDYLVGKGVAANRITVVSRGEDGSLCAEPTPACQGRNRRVRVLVRESEPLQLSASPSP